MSTGLRDNLPERTAFRKSLREFADYFDSADFVNSAGNINAVNSPPLYPKLPVLHNVAAESGKLLAIVVCVDGISCWPWRRSAAGPTIIRHCRCIRARQWPHSRASRFTRRMLTPQCYCAIRGLIVAGRISPSQAMTSDASLSHPMSCRWCACRRIASSRRTCCDCR